MEGELPRAKNPELKKLTLVLAAPIPPQRVDTWTSCLQYGRKRMVLFVQGEPTQHLQLLSFRVLRVAHSRFVQNRIQVSVVLNKTMTNSVNIAKKNRM